MLGPWVGPISIVPLVLLVVSVYVNSLYFGYLVCAGIAGSLLLSLWYCIVGFRAKVPWMLVWMFAFVLLLPFANIAFWLINRRRES